MGHRESDKQKIFCSQKIRANLSAVLTRNAQLLARAISLKGSLIWTTFNKLAIVEMWGYMLESFALSVGEFSDYFSVGFKW